jgi:hypothetical protein
LSQILKMALVENRRFVASSEVNADAGDK